MRLQARDVAEAHKNRARSFKPHQAAVVLLREGVARLDAALELAETARELCAGALRPLFFIDCKPIFEAYPELESFSWNQYLIVDEDGEEEEFHACWEEPHLSGVDRRNLLESVSKLLSDSGDEYLRILFGIGVRVTILRHGGVEIEELEEE